MVCPNCQETLLMTDRQGVEIDYCPKCRGVWLDRGELQKLIDSSLAWTETQSVRPERRLEEPRPPICHDDDRYYDEVRYGERYQDRYSDKGYEYRKPKKRESWFSELFDFD